MQEPGGLRAGLRRMAAHALGLVRRSPWLHAPVHALAVRLARHPAGAAMIRSVLEPQYLSRADYARWVERHDTLSEAHREAIRAHVGRFARRPKISVVMPVYAADETLLRQAIASVKAQLYPDWELCVADDASPGEAVWTALEAEAREDARIRIVRRPANGHISAATNSALALATGEFVALMDHDDLLAEQALYEVAAELQAHPDADLIYSDEDKIDAQGRRFEPHFKTGWNPELLLGQNYVSHLSVYRREVVERLGGLREGLEGAQDYDLTLRVSEAIPASHIRHIPTVLYHWRQQAGPGSFSETAAERCRLAAERAVREHLDRTGQAGARVERHPDTPTWLRVIRPLPDPAPMVSVIVPTRDRAELLARCVEGVLAHTDYPALELIIADNDSVDPRTHDLFKRLAADPRVRVIPAPGPFNYADINNKMAAQARGEVLLFLNNDVVVTEPGWLKAMVAQAVRPQVGAVGARLTFPDGRVQHGGVILGAGLEPHVAGNLYVGAPGDDPGYFHHLKLARNLSAVTAACLAMRKAVFDEAGGFDAEHLAVAFNDVDLCLKVGALGYQVIWTPLAELTHVESASRGSDLAPERQAQFLAEGRWMRTRWGDLLDNDPFHGPNFDHRRGDYRLADPPRRVPPWRRA